MLQNFTLEESRRQCDTRKGRHGRAGADQRIHLRIRFLKELDDCTAVRSVQVGLERGVLVAVSMSGAISRSWPEHALWTTLLATSLLPIIDQSSRCVHFRRVESRRRDDDASLLDASGECFNLRAVPPKGPQCVARVIDMPSHEIPEEGRASGHALGASEVKVRVGALDGIAEEVDKYSASEPLRTIHARDSMFASALKEVVRSKVGGGKPFAAERKLRCIVLQPKTVSFLPVKEVGFLFCREDSIAEATNASVTRTSPAWATVYSRPLVRVGVLMPCTGKSHPEHFLRQRGRAALESAHDK